MAYNREVVRKQGLGFTTLDFADLRQQELKRKRMLEESAKLEQQVADMEAKRRHDEAMENLSHRSIMTAKRTVALNTLHKQIPNMVLNECFNYIFTRALPHDADFIHENHDSITNMGALYMRKIGGMNGLYVALRRTNSPFLKEMYQFCKEFASHILMERTAKAQKAMTEADLKEIISEPIDDSDKEEIRSKMGSMGADELATLISNKVVDVVRDEQQRERDLADTEKHMVPDLTGEEQNEEATEGFHLLTENVEEKAKLALENYNPLTKTFTYKAQEKPKSFFYSLMCGVANKVVRESAMTEGADIPKQQVVPQVLLENPLNINIFDIYIQDKNEDLYDLVKLDISDRPVIARTSSLDKDFILSEALLQYTMFETAHTMKLVEITETDIRKQSDFLIKS